MKCIIIDDEILSINNLSHILVEHFPELELEKTFQDAQTAVEYLNDNLVDLVFLDIKMPGMDGFQLLNSLANRQFQVIFVTGYNEFAIKAIKEQAIDYLIKPIQIDELKYAIDRFICNYEKNKTIITKDKITIANSGGRSILQINDIMYIQGIDNLCKIHLSYEKSISLSKTLKHFEDTLDNRFYRIHKSYIINKDYIDKITNAEKKQLILKNGTCLPISRRNFKDFVNTLDSIST